MGAWDFLGRMYEEKDAGAMAGGNKRYTSFSCSQSGQIISATWPRMSRFVSAGNGNARKE